MMKADDHHPHLFTLEHLLHISGDLPHQAVCSLAFHSGGRSLHIGQRPVQTMVPQEMATRQIGVDVGAAKRWGSHKGSSA